MNQKINHVFMTDNYMEQKKSMNLSEVNKLEQAVDVHGYRGSSKMKHNGVVNIKPDDKQLWKSLNKYNIVEGKNMEKIINDNKLIKHYDVKVVAHCPNGNRGVGTIYKNDKGESALVLLGFANYNHQLY
jgi:hypothetical protein